MLVGLGDICYFLGNVDSVNCIWAFVGGEYEFSVYIPGDGTQCVKHEKEIREHIERSEQVLSLWVL